MVIVHTVSGEEFYLIFVDMALESLSIEFCFHVVLFLLGCLLEILHVSFTCQHRPNRMKKGDVVIEGSLQRF